MRPPPVHAQPAHAHVLDPRLQRATGQRHTSGHQWRTVSWADGMRNDNTGSMRGGGAAQGVPCLARQGAPAEQQHAPP
jgi:hypothetical protein